MKGWDYDLDNLPDLVIIEGQNASGKTVMLQRIIHRIGPEFDIRYIRVSELGLWRKGDNTRISTIKRIKIRLLSILDSLDNGNLAVFIDDTGLLTDSEFKKICAKLKGLYKKWRIHRAVITRLKSKEFKVRSFE